MSRKRKMRRSASKSRINRTRSQPLSKPIEPPLMVFISSVIRGMGDERETVEKAVLSLPIARSWRFEATPASTDLLEESYLRKVRECDLFILLVGRDDSSAVRREYDVALECNKPVLCFVKSVERSLELNDFVNSIQTKYAQYSSVDDLFHAVESAMADEIVKRYRSAVSDAEVREIVGKMANPKYHEKPDEILGGIIVGVDELNFISMYNLFGGQIIDDSNRYADAYYEDIFFDDFKEYNEVLGTLTSLMNQAKMSSGVKEEVFEKIWKEAVISRASQYITAHNEKKQRKIEPMPEGIRYIIMRVHHSYAPLIQGLRANEFIQPAVHERSAKQDVLFDDIRIPQIMSEAVSYVQDMAHDDPEEFKRLLVEVAMRIQMLGPDNWKPS